MLFCFVATAIGLVRVIFAAIAQGGTAFVVEFERCELAGVLSHVTEADEFATDCLPLRRLMFLADAVS